MATVYVGSARSDENGGAHSGKAGDQKNGKEVSTQSWYKHSKGWRVFRAKSNEVALKIAEAMEAACKNNKIGYDQWQRNTLYTQAEKVGFDVSKVTKACETDCSALVRVCCAYAGIIDLPSNMRTGDMPYNLMKTGAFVEMEGSKYTNQSKYLGAGDILVTKKSGHTVVVLNNGSKYEGTVEVNYGLGARILKKGMIGKDVSELQSALVSLGYNLGTYGAKKDGVDGEYGSKTVKAVKKFQKKYKLTVDGEYGTDSHAKLMEIVNNGSIFGIRVTANLVNIRTAPNTKTGKIVRIVNKNVRLSAVGTDSATGWYKLEDGNYICNKYAVKV